MNWRVFWRILFDVVKSKPRLQLEMTLWQLSPLNRLGRLVIDLVPAMNRVGTVFFVDNKAIFVGGYLECEVDLNHFAEGLLMLAGIEINDAAWENVSQSINGENVSIETEVALYNIISGPEYPLFYFPQPDSRTGVRLLESVSGTGNRRAIWQISDQPMMASNPSFTLEAFEGQHRVRVRQGLNTKENSIFNFLIDSIPTGNARTRPDHRFSGDPQTFYIGATPEHRGGLVGEIMRLDFDPNNSCVPCLAVINSKPDDDSGQKNVS